MSESKSIKVERINSGVLFPNDRGQKADLDSYHGAINIEGVSFDVEVTMTVAQEGKKDYYTLTGTQQEGGSESVSGRLFIEPEGPAKNGTGPKPNYTGNVTPKIEGTKYRLAAWSRVSEKGNPFLSLNVNKYGENKPA